MMHGEVVGTFNRWGATPAWLQEVINTGFIMTLVFLMSVLITYVLIHSIKGKYDIRRLLKPMLNYMVAFAILLIVCLPILNKLNTPITEVIYYADGMVTDISAPVSTSQQNEDAIPPYYMVELNYEDVYPIDADIMLDTIEFGTMVQIQSDVVDNKHRDHLPLTVQSEYVEHELGPSSNNLKLLLDDQIPVEINKIIRK